MFETAFTHLVRSGLFIFDFWYGPAVLAQRPEVRVKHLEDEIIEVTRTADPTLHLNENVVDVNYSVVVKAPKSLLPAAEAFGGIHRDLRARAAALLGP